MADAGFTKQKDKTIFDYLSDIIDQGVRTASAFSAPEKDTTDPSQDLPTSEAIANKLFTKKRLRIPAQEIANRTIYDTEQAFTRIMMLYNSGRAEFYKVAEKNAAVRKERMAEKGAQVSKMLKNAEKAENAYTRKKEEASGTGIEGSYMVENDSLA